MTNWIRHVVEPRRLLLAWQAPDHMQNRTRWAVGEVLSDEQGPLYREFSGPEFERMNDGQPRALLEELGYAGYPAFNPKLPEHRSGVIEAFLRRLPPRTRPDFARYMEHFRVPSDAVVSPFTLLALTEAKLPSDGFSLVNPHDPDVSECEFVLEVAGHRHYRDAADLSNSVGSRVEFVPEPDNPHDCNAVMIHWNGNLIGYVNRLQAGTFLSWIAQGRVSGEIERLNGTPDKPRVFLFVRVSRPTIRVAA